MGAWAMDSMEVPGGRAAEHPQGVRVRRKRQSRQRRTRGGGPYRSVYRSISGSGKRSRSIRQPPPPPLRLRRGLETFVKNGGTPCASPVLRPPAGAILLFLFWTVHGPFSLFLLEEKEKMGGAMNQPSSWLKSPPPVRASTRSLYAR